VSLNKRKRELHKDVLAKQQLIIGWNAPLDVQNAAVWDVTTLSKARKLIHTLFPTLSILHVKFLGKDIHVH